MKKILFLGLVYYIYKLKMERDGAVADRTALLGILTPNQQAALLFAVQAASQVGVAAAQGAVQGAMTAINTAVASK